MKVTNEGRLALGSLVSGLGGDPSLDPGEQPTDCCDSTTPPPDRAHDSDAVTVNTPSTGGIVQWKVGTFHANSALTETFDATPTNGNTMLAFLFQGGTIDTSGWTLRETGSTSDSDSLNVQLWSKVAGAAEPAAVHSPNPGAQTRRLVIVEVAGSLDVHDDLDNQSGASPLVGPTLTPAANPGILLAAFVGQVATYAGTPTWTPLGSLTTDTFLRVTSGRPVTWVGHQDTTTGSYTPSLTTTPLYAGRKTASVAAVVGATPTAVSWNVPAPLTVDDDDATYVEIEGPDVLRVDLGGAFRIVRSRLLVGSDDAGPRTYQIAGANEADFSDIVPLASLDFTATGSFTPDDLELLWTSDATYRYFQLTGSDETRRVFSWELYEPDTSQGQDHTHDSIEALIAANSTALDAHVAEILTHQTAETDDTLVLAPDGAGGVEWVAAGSGSLTDHTHAATGSGSNGGGATLAPTTLTLPVNATPAQTAEGSAVWDSDDDVLTVGDGASRKTFGYEGSTVGTALGTAAAGTGHEMARITHVHTLPKLDDLAAPDDNTDLDATTGVHGLLRKLPGGTTTYLRADGSFSTPSGTGVGAEDETLIVAMEVFG